MKEFLYTDKFVGRQYIVNNPHGRSLKHGDDVIVHPVPGKSQATIPFAAKVLFLWIKWIDNKQCVEACTHVYGGYSAVINDYLFSRLEPK